jgi:hypothetical protein
VTAHSGYLSGMFPGLLLAGLGVGAAVGAAVFPVLAADAAAALPGVRPASGTRVGFH